MSQRILTNNVSHIHTHTYKTYKETGKHQQNKKESYSQGFQKLEL